MRSSRPGRWLAVAAAWLAAVLLLAANPTAAHAANTVIDFENLPARTTVTNQYLAEGVDLDPSHIPNDIGFTPAPPDTCGNPPSILSDAAGAHSGDRVLESGCFIQKEFPVPSAIEGSFTTARSMVSLWTGRYSGDNSGPTSPTIELDGYNFNGQRVATASGVNTTPGSNLFLQISTTTPQIAYFVVSSSDHDFSFGLTIDDLAFDNPPAGSPDFNVALPHLVNAYRGTSIQVPVSIDRFDGSNGSVQLGLTGLPPDVSASFSPNPVPGSGTESTLTLTTTADAQQELGLPITLTAVPLDSGAGPQARQAHTQLNVSSPMTVSIEGSDLGPGPSLSMAPCAQRIESVRVDTTSAVTQPVNLQVAEAANRVTPSLSSASVPAGGGIVLLTLNRSPNAASGSDPITVTATSGDLPKQTASLDINPVQGSITSISSSIAQAPTITFDGGQLGIDGTGLCPGSTVQFGNTLAIATPNYARPDGTHLDTPIPRYATTGQLTIRTPAGQLVSGPTRTVSIDSFRDVWGLPFSNYLLPYGDVNADAAVRLFGHDQVYDSTPLGDVEDPEAAVWVTMAKSMVGGGVCFGMVAFSQHSPKDGGIDWLPNTFSPGALNGVYALIGPAGPTPQLDEEVSKFHLDQYSAQFLDYQHGMLDDENAPPTRTVDAVRQWAQNGGPPVLIIMQNASTNSGHAVLAYDVEDDGFGGWFIDVYDPNNPYTPGEDSDTTGATHQAAVQASRIHVSPNGNWTFLPLSYSGDTAHMFPVPWGTIPDPYAFNPDQRPQIAGIAQLVEAIDLGSASRTTQITNRAGRVLFASSGGENLDRRTRIPGAQLVDPAVGSGTPAPVALLPSGASYRITATGRAAGNYQEVLRGGRFDALVEAPTAAGQHDQIGLTDSANRVQFVTSAAAKRFTLDAVARRGGSKRILELTGTSFRGAGDVVSLPARGGTIQYEHRGAATTVEFRLSNVSSQGLPVAFDSGPLRVGADQVVRLRPSSWQRLDAVAMVVTGPGVHRRLLLHTHAPALGRPRGVVLRIKPAGRRRSTLTLDATVGRLAPEAQLELVFDVRRGGRVVDHNVVTLTGAALTRGRHRATFLFAAPSAGRYLVRASATVLLQTGLIERAAATSRSSALRVR